MSTVQRTVFVNPVEPSPLSLRVPGSMETRLAVTFYTQRGTASVDLLAQLELTGRSSGLQQSYVMPSVDVANGKARAIIPADDLKDPNGYRLNLYGSVDGLPQLLATGKLDVLSSAGLQPVPLDTIDQIDLTFTRDADVLLTVTLWADAGKDAPYDLTSTSIAANVYAAQGGGVLVPFAVAALSANEVQLSLTFDQVNALPDVCWWSLTAATAGGLTTLCEGRVTVSDAVT